MNYRLAGLFGDFDEILGEHQLLQMVEFSTWSRVVADNLRSSILDHVYVQDPTTVSHLSSIIPPFGDHSLVHFRISFKKPDVESVLKRDWPV